ncbi:phosphate/phosphite/phosphonate ABC transporter substrate-binding protein [Thalassovita taeanensis]|uniref:ABC transporter, phosphonate, substrate-binding protein n=1 Tax=Thalassovita taeanensis TaxID=657014 RepID=A0A1H9L4J4_9RHOB|nr:PhnD/SsuA/transferrin family substrate-binding protein [Thalassovita taeanensis]SER06364.1 ABC transporter, phosphonate, substrate-binding protein [Thalassovita taeanensis]
MIAALGMYDRPETAAANDRLWAAIRDQIGDGPTALTRDRDFHEIWTDPDLLFAQTCGLPFRTSLRDRVALIGTPDYGLPGCAPGYYHSSLVVRRADPATQLADFAEKTIAYNGPDSQSGWAAPMAAAATANISFAHTLRTGAHRASALAVAEGRADIAAIDSVTWALLCQNDTVANDLRVLTTTAPTPGLPYITAPGRDTGSLFAATAAAIAALSPQDRETLHLTGLVAIPASAYLALPPPPPPV